jgi:hypothetical protein
MYTYIYIYIYICIYGPRISPRDARYGYQSAKPIGLNGTLAHDQYKNDKKAIVHFMQWKHAIAICVYMHLQHE